MNISNSVFKFVSIRNATNKITNEPRFTIQPKTALVGNLTRVLMNEQKQPEKLNTFNEQLNAYVKSKDFFKTKLEAVDAAEKMLNNKHSGKTTIPKIDLKTFYEQLYNNIVIRTITKSNTNEVFKFLVDTIRGVYQKINSDKVKLEDLQHIRIVLPEGLVFSFNFNKKENPIITPKSTEETDLLLKKITDLVKQKSQLIASKVQNETNIRTEQRRFIQLQGDVAENQTRDTQPAKLQKLDRSHAKAAAKSDPPINLAQLEAIAATLSQEEIMLNAEIADLNKRVFRMIPETKYGYVGSRYVDITDFKPKVDIAETILSNCGEVRSGSTFLTDSIRTS